MFSFSSFFLIVISEQKNKSARSDIFHFFWMSFSTNSMILSLNVLEDDATIDKNNLSLHCSIDNRCIILLANKTLFLRDVDNELKIYLSISLATNENTFSDNNLVPEWFKDVPCVLMFLENTSSIRPMDPLSTGQMSYGFDFSFLFVFLHGH